MEISIDIEVTPVVTYYSPAEPAVDSEDGGYRGCPAGIQFYLLDPDGRPIPEERISDSEYEQVRQQLLEAIARGEPQVQFETPPPPLK